MAAGRGTRPHPPKLRTVEEERVEAAREEAAVAASWSHHLQKPTNSGFVDTREGGFDGGGMVLIKFSFSAQPTRIAARNLQGALNCGAKLVEEPVHMKETVNGHVAPSASPRIYVL